MVDEGTGKLLIRSYLFQMHHIFLDLSLHRYKVREICDQLSFNLSGK